ncbi:MAG: TetR/AcrR family transcriptional regulator [Acidimicrobiales bacterium]|nr:TetR/AcrR family transcriptional regulator [Acidimicrobiales bacterium]
MGRTQEERRAETRALLLDAAADLFAHKGFHATSAEAVAAAANRTTGALYNHFGNKEGLLLALVENWVEQTISDLTPAIEGAAELRDRLDAVWAGIVRRDSETGDAWLLLEFELWLHAVRDPELGAVGAERFRLLRESLAGGLAVWAEEFDFDLPAPVEDVSAQIIGLLLGAAFQYRLDPTSVTNNVVRDGFGRLLGLSTVAVSPAST